MIQEIANVHALAELMALDDLGRGAGDRQAVKELLGALVMAEQFAGQGLGPELLPDIEAARQVLERVHRRPVPIGVTSGELQQLREVLAAVHQQRGLAGMGRWSARWWCWWGGGGGGCAPGEPLEYRRARGRISGTYYFS